MAGPTAVSLVTELGLRCGDTFNTARTQQGDGLHWYDTNLATWIPGDVANLNAWLCVTIGTSPTFYGEFRAASYTALTGLLQLVGAGLPGIAASAGLLCTRWPYSRKLAAINSGIHQLGLSWYRSFMDETGDITTVANQWRYPLPTVDQSGKPLNWTGINKVQVQISLDNTLVGYPYIDAAPWNYNVFRTTDDNGNTQWYIQFGILPPPGRIVRLFGELQVPDLVYDTDVLPIDGNWAVQAEEWLYDWAMYRLLFWEGMRQPASLGEKYKVWSLDRLNAAKDELMQNMPVHGNARLVVPGRGTGTFEGAPLGGSPQYLGAFRSLH